MSQSSTQLDEEGEEGEEEEPIEEEPEEEEPEEVEEEKKEDPKEEKKEDSAQPLHVPVLPILEPEVDRDPNNGFKIQASPNKLVHEDV